MRCSANAGSTYQRIAFRRTRFTWYAVQPFETGPALERLVGADGPEPLGEAARRAEVAGAAVDRVPQLRVHLVDRKLLLIGHFARV